MSTHTSQYSRRLDRNEPVYLISSDKMVVHVISCYVDTNFWSGLGPCLAVINTTARHLGIAFDLGYRQRIIPEYAAPDVCNTILAFKSQLSPVSHSVSTIAEFGRTRRSGPSLASPIVPHAEVIGESSVTVAHPLRMRPDQWCHRPEQTRDKNLT